MTNTSLQGLDATLTALDAELARIAANAYVAMEAVAGALEGWAKTEHTYQDRTGDNSGSIKAFIDEVTPQAITVLLTAGMPYSSFLEKMASGKWAYLMPAIENHKDDINTIVEQIMSS